VNYSGAEPNFEEGGGETALLKFTTLPPAPRGGTWTACECTRALTAVELSDYVHRSRPAP
jgi:hypothetical protein